MQTARRAWPSLDLTPDAIEALLCAKRAPVTTATVHALLVADNEPDDVENGFGLGTLKRLSNTADRRRCARQ